MSEDSKFFLKDSDVPKQWYNLVADLKEPMSPPLHPGTKQPIGPDDLAPLFPMELIMQEVSQERHIDIPKPVVCFYFSIVPTFNHKSFTVTLHSFFGLI